MNPGSVNFIGAARNPYRYTGRQPVVPGSGAFDFVPDPAAPAGRVPAVGNYPSGAPSMGLSAYLADDGDGSSSSLPAMLLAGGVLVAIGAWAWSKR